MYIYYKINQENIYSILSSLIVDVSNGSVYEFQPEIKKNEILIKIKIKDNDRFNIINLEYKIGLMNSVFNLENEEIKFYFYSNEQKNQVVKLANLMKEIKIKNEDLEKYFYVYKDCKKIIKQEYYYKPISVVNEENQKAFKRLNILKGIIYCALSDKNMVNRYILQEYSIFYNEYKILEKMLYELKDKETKNLNVFRALNKSKNVLKSEIEKNLSLSNFEDMIIKDIDKKQISFNNKFINLLNKDNKLFDKIMSLIINNLYNIDNNKLKVIKLVKLIGELVHEYKIESDYEILYKRVINDDFSVSIEKINNIVIKNLFVACIKYNNNREFLSFLFEKNIENKCLAYMFFGGIIGFMYLGSAMLSLENNSILKHNLKKIESRVIKLDNQKYWNRLKIHYYLDKLYENLSILENDYENFYVKVDLRKESLKIYLKDLKAIMEIYYHKRNKNLAKTIKYYDNRVKKLKEINKNYNPNDIYFSYNFIIINKTKTLDYRYEYIFATILQYIFVNVRE